MQHRFPSIKKIQCCFRCGCLINKDEVVTEVTQMVQDAKAGDACYYCTNRQPMAFNEVDKCCKGHSSVVEHIRQQPLQRQGTRRTTRFMCDACGEGMVCGQVENTNVCDYTNSADATAAEFIQTCLTEHFFGNNDVDIVLAG